MAADPILEAHREWLGYLQPVGLVVAPTALANAQAVPNPKILAEHNRFLAHVRDVPLPGSDEDASAIADWPRFAFDVLGWQPTDLVGHGDAGPVPEALEVALPEYGETLRPTYAVPDPNSGDDRRWLMLIEVLPIGTPLDEAPPASGTRWDAPPQSRFERLLRETQVPIGLLVNGTHIRLVYAPRGESSGHLTFPVSAMTEVAGRPIFSAMLMLLSEERLFSIPDPKHRLPAILAESRKYQNDVSTKLAGQVLSALYELVRGFQSADDHTRGELLRSVLASDPDSVYGGLLTVLLRLVFLLYAEDRGLLSDDSVYLEHYSIGGLFERLRADAAVHPDTMDSRYGSWPQLLSLFRLVHDGGGHGAFRLPARKGYLFDPDRYPFLEGRATGHQSGRIDPPMVADGVIHRVLERLLILDGERLSYRTLDVEQIGSVYETMMGFRVEIARGRSIAVKAKKSHGAPTAVDLDSLLAVDPKDRAKTLKGLTDQDVTGDGLKSARTVDDLVAALGRKVAAEATPRVVPPGAMVLQPSDERRRSGSHYTPRALTEPIVRTALQPILSALGPEPTPDQVLDLKVCDPAMGSGAFLVEACRQLGDALVRAWHAHGQLPEIPPDEDETLHARRVVAQRCLYGVDRNPMAVDLAKLSLWLATLAKDHPFTFLDHALRHGDSLVGLSRDQIVNFHWNPEFRKLPFMPSERIASRIERASAFRREIREAAEATPEALLSQKLALADEALNPLRFYGDLALSAFFAGANDKARKAALGDLADGLSAYFENPHHLHLREPLEKAIRDAGIASPSTPHQPSTIPHPSSPINHQPSAISHPLHPFHWQIEFPEVFDRPNPGFDAIVGNPPFAGKNTMAEANPPGYPEWLKTLHAESHGNSDLVAHFFRRSFNLLRAGGTFGLIATNTIGQGDTRSTGLRWICLHGGTIYQARKRLKWPGMAAVVVSVVHVLRAPARGGGPGREYFRSGDDKNTSPYASGAALPGRDGRAAGGVLFDGGPSSHETSSGATVPPIANSGARAAGSPFLLDGKPVPIITAYLFHAGGHEDPARLKANANKSFQGSIVLGMGFTFDDTDTKGVASPIAEMHRLIAKDPRNADRIFPYIGGDELNNEPSHKHHRYAISFGEMSEAQARAWPDLMAIIEEKVKPGRLDDNREIRRKYWWRYGEVAPALYDAISHLDYVLALNCRATPHMSFARIPSKAIFANTLDIFPIDDFASFCTLQSRPHEIWARFFASSMKDDLRYTPSDCFETFPFPPDYESSPALEEAGRAYYEFRAALMVRNDEGLTKTYNRFHDPDERSPEILRLRELHAAMDRAVLDAYGWSDVQPTCEFLLDYEDDEGDDAEPPVGGRRRKKPYRYRWPDATRDDVLARLLQLNRERAEAESRAAAIGSMDAPAAKRAKGAGRGKSRTKPGDAGQSSLF